MSAAATLAKIKVTPEELLRMPDEVAYELIGGEVRIRNKSTESSYIAGRVFKVLDAYCEASRPGWVFPMGASFQCFLDDSNRVRRADSAYIELDRFERSIFLEQGHIKVAPDLAVEVVSLSDRWYDIEEKVEQWLAAGVRAV